MRRACGPDGNARAPTARACCASLRLRVRASVSRRRGRTAARACARRMRPSDLVDELARNRHLAEGKLEV
eukprot:757856-Prymnesium_polylepis.1